MRCGSECDGTAVAGRYRPCNAGQNGTGRYGGWQAGTGHAVRVEMRRYSGSRQVPTTRCGSECDGTAGGRHEAAMRCGSRDGKAGVRQVPTWRVASSRPYWPRDKTDRRAAGSPAKRCDRRKADKRIVYNHRNPRVVNHRRLGLATGYVQVRIHDKTSENVHIYRQHFSKTPPCQSPCCVERVNHVTLSRGCCEISVWKVMTTVMTHNYYLSFIDVYLMSSLIF